MERHANIHPDNLPHVNFGTLNAVRGLEFPKYYLRVIKSISTRQKLNLKKAVKWQHIPFSISPSLLRRWELLFQTTEDQSAAFFTYHVKVGRDFLFDALSALGANFLNLMYLGVNVSYHKTNYVYRPGEEYYSNAEIQSVSLLNHNRAIIKAKGEIYDASGELLLTQCDKFFLSNLSEADIEQLKQSPWSYSDDIAQYRGLSKRTSQLSAKAGVRCSAFQLPKNTGFKFGVISGDLNPIHTQSIFSKMAGHKKSFVQGLFTANYMLNTLINKENLAVSNFDIKLCNPIYTNMLIHLLYDDERFEFLDKDQKVLAFGAWQTGFKSH